MVKHRNDGRSFFERRIFVQNYISFRIFPDYFYTFTLWESDKKTKLIDFVMIDTVLLCGGSNSSDWEHGPLEGPSDSLLAEDYWQWIEDQLKQST
jgi:hypothetical protein